MKNKLIALAAAVVAMVPLTNNPAAAQGAGSLAFECEAELGAFPSAGASGTCKGKIGPRAIAAGGLAGNGSAGAYLITGAGDFFASFSYAEGCVASEPPAIGTANGTATITGMPAVNKGVPTTAGGTLTFTWTRVGLTAFVTIHSATISFANGGRDSVALGAATAAFVPLLGQDNTCPRGGPLDAVVAGVAAFGG